LRVSPTIPYYLLVVLKLVRSTVLLVFGFMYLAYIDSIFLLPTIFILQYSRIYVSVLESSYIATKVKASVNESFCFCSIL